MKNLYSKSLMAAVAVMMLASCSNEEPNVNPYEGKTSDVTISMSVKGMGTKASPDDVNMDNDENIAKISNVVIVPMVGSAFQNPIMFGDVKTADNGTKNVTRTLPQTVNKFRVYGNAISGADIKEQKVFAEGDLVMSVGNKSLEVGGREFFAPHNLYYYKEDDNFYMEQGDSYGAASWSATSNKQAIGENNLIKISGVNYKVGVLAALIQNGDNSTLFYTNENCTTLADNAGKFDNSYITVTGITVAEQTQSFNINWEPQGKVDIYETSALKTIYVDGTTKLSHSDRSIGNIYCVVAPTSNGDKVTLNIEFKVKEGIYFKRAGVDNVSNIEQDVLGNGDTFYLPVVLDATKSETGTGAGEVFVEDYATLLNATVKNWGLGDDEPVKSTDVTIGVEFDVDWEEGLVFNLDI